MVRTLASRPTSAVPSGMADVTTVTSDGEDHRGPYRPPTSPTEDRVWRRRARRRVPRRLRCTSVRRRSRARPFRPRGGVDAGDDRSSTAGPASSSGGTGPGGIDIAEHLRSPSTRAGERRDGRTSVGPRRRLSATGLGDRVGRRDHERRREAVHADPRSPAFRELDGTPICRGAARVMTSWDYHRQPVGRPPRCGPSTAGGGRPWAYRGPGRTSTTTEHGAIAEPRPDREATRATAAESDGEDRSGIAAVQMIATHEAHGRAFSLPRPRCRATPVPLPVAASARGTRPQRHLFGSR